MPDVKFAKLVVFINAAVPCFLLLSLAVTPLRKVLGLPWMVQFRRLLGLYAFFYGCLHLLAYTWFDKGFAFRAIVADTLKRPFIFLGMLSFLIMVPLAVTSTSKMIKRMGGRRWNLLHRTVYLSALAGVLHYYLLVKADVRLPLAFAAVLALLLAYRLLNKFHPAFTERRPKRAPSLSRN